MQWPTIPFNNNPAYNLLVFEFSEMLAVTRIFLVLKLVELENWLWTCSRILCLFYLWHLFQHAFREILNVGSFHSGFFWFGHWNCRELQGLTPRAPNSEKVYLAAENWHFILVFFRNSFQRVSFKTEKEKIKKSIEFSEFFVHSFHTIFSSIIFWEWSMVFSFNMLE